MEPSTMSGARQLVLTLALVAVVALAAVVANLALLRSTEDSSDQVGRLSPRAVFSLSTEPSRDTSPAGTAPSASGTRHDANEPDD